MTERLDTADPPEPELPAVMLINCFTYSCVICADKLDDKLGPRHSADYTVPCCSWSYPVIYGYGMH